jgi:hypothetical protein
LLLASGSFASPTQLWPLVEADLSEAFQEIDRIRFSLSPPHQVAAAAAAP